MLLVCVRRAAEYAALENRQLLTGLDIVRAMHNLDLECFSEAGRLLLARYDLVRSVFESHLSALSVWISTKVRSMDIILGRVLLARSDLVR